MAINYEFERNIQDARDRGDTYSINLIRSQQVLFNSLVDSGFVIDLPREISDNSEQFANAEGGSTFDDFELHGSSDISLLSKRLRRIHGATQDDIASQSGVHLNTIKQIESSEANPRFKTLQSVVSGFGGKLLVRLPKGK